MKNTTFESAKNSSSFASTESAAQEKAFFMNAKTITKEVLRLEFDGESRDFDKTPLNQKSVCEPDWNELVNVLKVALKKRMEECRANVMTNTSEVIYCTDNEVWFQDHSSFSVRSYEAMEDAYNRLCDNYAKPQERIGLMPEVEVYQCLKALAELGLPYKELPLFDYVLSIYQNRIRDAKF